jgi:hypothetical protein
MEIPKPVIDLTFKRTLERFKIEMDSKMIHGKKTMYPYPYFIWQVLERCKEKDEILFIEYIIYLKLYNKQKVLPYLSKVKKDMIIKEIKGKYGLEIDYKKLGEYLKSTFKELAEILGYSITVQCY